MIKNLICNSNILSMGNIIINDMKVCNYFNSDIPINSKICVIENGSEWIIISYA